MAAHNPNLHPCAWQIGFLPSKQQIDIMWTVRAIHINQVINKALHFQQAKQTLTETKFKLGLKSKEKRTSNRYLAYKTQATTQQCVIMSRKIVTNSSLQMSSQVSSPMTGVINEISVSLKCKPFKCKNGETKINTVMPPINIPWIFLPMSNLHDQYITWKEDRHTNSGLLPVQI